jgi:16S rRNA G966 N2-methylase RsmD
VKTIWYMGVKSRLIRGFIDEALAEAAPPGSTLLDVFSGTAAVGTALASRHRIVSNDVQRYAAAVARAYLDHDEAKKADLLASLDPVRDLAPAFLENRKALEGPLEEALALEDAFLLAHGLAPAAADPGFEGLLPEEPCHGRALARARATLDGLDRAGLARAYRAFALEATPRFEEAREARFPRPFAKAASLLARSAVLARRRDPALAPYLLATAYYPNVYLGIRQAIATDSLRHAIDRIDARDPFAREKRAHYLGALLHALSVTTSATSHFCQPRGLTNEGEVQAVLARRAVSIASRAVAFSREIASVVRETRFRAGNSVVSGDWRGLFREGADAWAGGSAPPAVVYMDPPYTSDNYSRFYHLLEVVCDYDYPPLDLRGGEATKGRYPSRERRHQSAFCRRSSVERELEDLLAASARTGAAVVLSYSLESGLLLRKYREDDGLSDEAALERFCGLARTSFDAVELRERALRHSGQGDSNRVVTELLLVCRGPRAARLGARPRGRRASA